MKNTLEKYADDLCVLLDVAVDAFAVLRNDSGCVPMTANRLKAQMAFCISYDEFVALDVYTQPLFDMPNKIIESLRDNLQTAESYKYRIPLAGTELSTYAANHFVVEHSVTIGTRELNLGYTGIINRFATSCAKVNDLELVTTSDIQKSLSEYENIDVFVCDLGDNDDAYFYWAAAAMQDEYEINPYKPMSVVAQRTKQGIYVHAVMNGSQHLKYQPKHEFKHLVNKQLFKELLEDEDTLFIPEVCHLVDTTLEPTIAVYVNDDETYLVTTH